MDENKNTSGLKLRRFANQERLGALDIVGVGGTSSVGERGETFKGEGVIIQ